MRQDSERMEANCLLRRNLLREVAGHTKNNLVSFVITGPTRGTKVMNSQSPFPLQTIQKYSSKRSYHTGIGGKTTVY